MNDKNLMFSNYIGEYYVLSRQLNEMESDLIGNYS